MGGTNIERSALNPTTSAERVVWLDVARGICMLLVVFMHFDGMFYANFVSWDQAGKAWDAATSAARPFRIPGFFLISGILASSYLSRSWREILEKRIVIQLYTFFLWSAIHLVVLFSLYTNLDYLAVVELGNRLLLNMIWPTTQIWFLWALVVYFLAALVLRKISVFAIIISIIMYIASSFIDNTVGMQLCSSFVFFILGCYFPSFGKSLGKSRSFPFLLSLLVGYIGGVFLIFALGEKTVGVWLPATLCGVALLFHVSAYLASTPISKPLSYIGRHTLPIYVVHGVILMVLGAWTRWYSWNAEKIPYGMAIDVVLPILGNILLVATCIGIYALGNRFGGGWLFRPPRPITDALRDPAKKIRSRSATTLSRSR